MHENFFRGAVMGAVLGVLAYSLVRDRLAWYDRELDRLDRNFRDHVFASGDAAHAPPPPPPTDA